MNEFLIAVDSDVDNYREHHISTLNLDRPVFYGISDVPCQGTQMTGAVIHIVAWIIFLGKLSAS